MDWKQFVTEMAKALAWPGVALCLLFLVRQQLPELLKRIKAASVGCITWSSIKALDKAKSSAEA